MGIYQGLKWPQALIQITLSPSCSHHRSMHTALAFFHLLGHRLCGGMCLLLLPCWWELLKHARSWSTGSHQRHLHHSQGHFIPANSCLHITGNVSRCTAGMGALLCHRGWLLAWSPWFTLELVHVWHWNYTRSPRVLQNSPRLFQWVPQLVMVGILDIRYSALTEIINFSKCSFTSFFVNRW